MSGTLTGETNSTSPFRSPTSGRTILWYELSLVNWSSQPNSPGQPVQRVQFDRSAPFRLPDRCQPLSIMGPIQRVQSHGQTASGRTVQWYELSLINSPFLVGRNPESSQQIRFNIDSLSRTQYSQYRTLDLCGPRGLTSHQASTIQFVRPSRMSKLRHLLRQL